MSGRHRAKRALTKSAPKLGITAGVLGAAIVAPMIGGGGDVSSATPLALHPQPASATPAVAPALAPQVVHSDQLKLASNVHPLPGPAFLPGGQNILRLIFDESRRHDRDGRHHAFDPRDARFHGAPFRYGRHSVEHFRSIHFQHPGFPGHGRPGHGFPGHGFPGGEHGRPGGGHGFPGGHHDGGHGRPSGDHGHGGPGGHDRDHGRGGDHDGRGSHGHSGGHDRGHSGGHSGGHGGSHGGSHGHHGHGR